MCQMCLLIDIRMYIMPLYGFVVNYSKQTKKSGKVGVRFFIHTCTLNEIMLIAVNFSKVSSLFYLF